jgi:predicted transcriptional regulator of viral defense system
MPKTASPELKTGSISVGERSLLAALERRRQRRVNIRADRDLLEDFTAHPYSMVHRMAAKGLLLPVASGTYLVAPPTGSTLLEQAAPIQIALDARLSAHGEYFISYFTGLIEHRLTDLDESTIYVAFRGGNLRNVRISGRPVHLTRINSDRKWFGSESVVASGGQRRGPRYYRARLERVLLDGLDRPRLCGSPEIVLRGWERAFREKPVDVDWLVGNAPAMGYSVVRRTGFWLDLLG